MMSNDLVTSSLVNLICLLDGSQTKEEILKDAVTKVARMSIARLNVDNSLMPIEAPSLTMDEIYCLSYYAAPIGPIKYGITHPTVMALRRMKYLETGVLTEEIKWGSGDVDRKTSQFKKPIRITPAGASALEGARENNSTA